MHPTASNEGPHQIGSPKSLFGSLHSQWLFPSLPIMCTYIYYFWHCHPNNGTEGGAAGQDKVASYSIVNKRAVLRTEANEQSIHCTPTTNWRVLYWYWDERNSKFWHQNANPLVQVQAQDASILSNLNASIPIAHKLSIIL
jgi:hypothetical protein